MAQRRIGHEALRFDTAAERQTSLDELAALIDWSSPERALAFLYKAAKGEKAWPPLSMFKAPLLATWHDLSDVALAEALSDRASFRRFCGFARGETTPERTAGIALPARACRARSRSKFV
jgi:transposase, IS5 family